jgi:hypothetical protein
LIDPFASIAEPSFAFLARVEGLNALAPALMSAPAKYAMREQMLRELSLSEKNSRG